LPAGRGGSPSEIGCPVHLLLNLDLLWFWARPQSGGFGVIDCPNNIANIQIMPPQIKYDVYIERFSFKIPWIQFVAQFSFYVDFKAKKLQPKSP
jgi:hypothetical protein